MAFTDTQLRQLSAKLDGRHVRTRQANGATLAYIEGWHAIAEANRIFGHDGWNRVTLHADCIWNGGARDHHAAAYVARVRVTVRAGATAILRDGSGTGEGRGPTPGQAHDMALKAAETDATKRALATFGNPFGLALYDRELAAVRNRQRIGTAASGANVEPDLKLRSATGSVVHDCTSPQRYVEALRAAMTTAPDIEGLFDLWEHNVETVRALSRAAKARGTSNPGLAKDLVAHLRACAAALAKDGSEPGAAHLPAQINGSPTPTATTGIDKSALALAEPRRLRSKEHLRFVAQQPCLICGRTPSQAHHLRFAQPRGVSLKVSDEFAVPLCAIHHTEIHHMGDETRWWREHNIDPLPIAERLWHDSGSGKRPFAHPAEEPSGTSRDARNDRGHMPG